MKNIVVTIFLTIIVISSISYAQEEERLGPENWPTTVEGTVADIISSLSEEDKNTVKNTKRKDLIQYLFGWGMGIRNHYGLRRGNNKLIENACGEPCNPDTASMIIIEAVWDSLQNKANHAIKADEK